MKVVVAHGPAGLFDFFPLLFIGAAVWVILTVLREGQNKNAQTRTIPRSPLSRQMHAATRRRGGPDRSTAPSERPRRFGPPPHLRVMEGEAEGNRPVVPRRFEPPPPQRRRKTG